MHVDSTETEIATRARRVGDAQRYECAEFLADAFVRGELSQEEFDARTELCLGAVTVADLSLVTEDLPIRVTPAASASTLKKDTRPGFSTFAKLVGFEVVLFLVAYALGVDLEAERRSWYVIALEIWVVGNLSGFGGAFFLQSARSSTRADRGAPGIDDR